LAETPNGQPYQNPTADGPQAGMGGEWRGVSVVDRIEPKPIAPARKYDAPVVVVVAPHGVALPELPAVVTISRKSHALSLDRVDPFASGKFESG
jgi:hypothetical protein